MSPQAPPVLCLVDSLNTPELEKLNLQSDLYQEVLLTPQVNRFVLYPIKYHDIWDMYKKAFASFWGCEEIDLSKDKPDWEKLTDNERYFISHVLAFFSMQDGIITENLAERFLKEVQITEAKFFYTYQAMDENIHSELYSLLIDSYIEDKVEKDKLLNPTENFPAIKKKAEWSLKWIDSNESFATRLVAFSIVEGVFFSGAFASIFWLKKRGLMPGLAFSNELISKDEGMHRDFAVLLYKKYIKNKLSEIDINMMMREAVLIEQEFWTEALPVSLIGMNVGNMKDYIEFVADHLLDALGYNKIYNTINPFDWMDLISLESKTQFFERKVSEYAKAGVMNPDANQRTFSLDADF